MSYHKRKDGRWQVNYRDEHGKYKTKYFPPGKAGKNKARAFDDEIAYLKSNNKPLPRSAADGIRIDTLAQEWLDMKKAQGRKKQWLSDWAHIFNEYLMEPLCAKPAEDLTQADILAAVANHWENASQSTRNRYIGYLKAILQYGVHQGYILKNPLTQWVKGKESSRRSRLTWDDLMKIKAYAGKKGSRCPHLNWAITVAWRIPARPGQDLYGLRFSEHIRWDRGEAEIYHSKVDEWAVIKLKESFLWELKAKSRQSKSGYIIEYARRPVKRLNKSLANAASEVGLTYPVTMYDLRHLWITTALDRGVEPSVIAYMAGTSVEMIHKNYYEPHAVEKCRATEIMPDDMDQETTTGKVVRLGDRGEKS